MARRALDRARCLAPGRPAAGVACTASLATDRPKKGDHRLHLTVLTGCGRGGTWSLTLHKSARDREGEEAILDALLLNAMAEAFGVAARVPVPLLPGEEVERRPCTRHALASLLAGDGVQALRAEPDGRHALTAAPPRAVLPGAFNPLHEGHRRLAAEAARRLGCEVDFELSVVHVDKGILNIEEVRQRLAQFAGLAGVWVTRAPTFAEKAALFPGATFVVGADTAERIFASRYYPDGEPGLADALNRVRGLGCRFLVACRPLPGGGCLGLENLDVPEAGHGLFVAIPREELTVDVSSTQLRAAVRP
jgi:hypothetical protein